MLLCPWQRHFTLPIGGKHPPVHQLQWPSLTDDLPAEPQKKGLCVVMMRYETSQLTATNLPPQTDREPTDSRKRTAANVPPQTYRRKVTAAN